MRSMGKNVGVDSGIVSTALSALERSISREVSCKIADSTGVLLQTKVSLVGVIIMNELKANIKPS